jgi:hypothetical protein
MGVLFIADDAYLILCFLMNRFDPLFLRKCGFFDLAMHTNVRTLCTEIHYIQMHHTSPPLHTD